MIIIASCVWCHEVHYDITSDHILPDIMTLRSAGKLHENPCVGRSKCPQISTSLITRRDYFKSKYSDTYAHKNATLRAKVSRKPSNRVKTIYKFPLRKG